MYQYAREAPQHHQYSHAQQQYPNHPPPAGQYDYSRKPVNMSDQNPQNYKYLNPQLGATFVPSGYDDFYMPEVVSPTPQRIMPEVPSNMQEGLAHLELEARNPPSHRMSNSSTVSSMQSPYLDAHRSSTQGAPRSGGGYQHTNASAYQDMGRGSQYGGAPLESPKFSPFPKLRDPGPNVPPSDEEKEEVLDRARPLVLKSTDPEMQLAWAQDALSWVEIASQAAARSQPEGQPGRSITPKVEHQLREDALNIVRFLAEQHHPKAEFMKGQWLEFGKFGYRVDKKEAFLGYKRAAEKGYARAEYRIGMQYENSNNSAKAVEHYRKGVAMRDSASNYRLGMMTLLGQHGMPQDYQRGVDLIRFAAETADENAPQGAYVYGMLLARELPNITVPDQYLGFDLNEAKMFIEKAAYLGFAKAQLKMGQAYELCQLGCEFEPALSLHYNALAARQGEPEAEMAISKWFLCGYEGVFEKSEELAFTYAKKAAAAKLPTAEFAMGYFYEIGMYVPVDLHESESWYKKAGDHGNKDALGRIESIKKNNTLSKKDHEQVAISRIKSQYGSQRGGRPDRFKQKPAPMGAMVEESMDMPDPRASYGGPAVAPLRPNKNLLPQPPAGAGRPTSTAPYPSSPYPLEDGPPSAPAAYQTYGNQGLRPGSGPNSRPGSSSGPQADRPSSAFGIRPPSHANTGEFGQPSFRPQEMRPSTSMGNMQVPQGGRGHNPAGRDRVVSAGPSVSAGWEPQMPNNYRQTGQAPTLPPVDFGRPTNFDPMGGPSKLQKAPPNMMKAQPAQPYPDEPYGRPPSGANTAVPPRRDPAANQYVRPERGSSMQPMMSPPIMSPPGHNDGRQGPSLPRLQGRQDSGPPPQSQSRQSQRPPQHTMSSQGPDSKPSSVAPSVASTGSGPPKKQGPSTFEEMGIPPSKQEGDCVMM
ncbi:related to SKT5 protein [Phialocephala subalpina]|uniref:Related to SKT5 protein n=1 Tax=Phialocephala subalpina TaxID=576137 RepID=A0A1L7WXX6_9HELO|nr:related to SKT5 protein [Phialocephala subalpina]